APLLARHLARRDLALRVDLLLTHDALVILEREVRVQAGQAALADFLAVVLLVDDVAAPADAAHRQDAGRRVAGAVLAVFALLALDHARRDLVVAGVVGLLDAIVGGRLGLFELADAI